MNLKINYPCKNNKTEKCKTKLFQKFNTVSVQLDFTLFFQHLQ